MIKLYEVSKDKRKYHILTDKEVIENLETSLNEKEQQMERLQEQLNEARKAIKLYAKTKIGQKQDGGTYVLHLVSGEIDWLNPLNSRTYMKTIVYDPRPAKK